MGRFHGKVGYSITQEDINEPGIWKDNIIIEQTYTGDVLTDYRKTLDNERLTGDLDISNRFSIVADSFAYENCSKIRYVEYLGVLWNVKNVEPRYPRIIISVGGVYNGPTPTAPNGTDESSS